MCEIERSHDDIRSQSGEGPGLLLYDDSLLQKPTQDFENSLGLYEGNTINDPTIQGSTLKIKGTTSLGTSSHWGPSFQHINPWATPPNHTQTTVPSASQ